MRLASTAIFEDEKKKKCDFLVLFCFVKGLVEREERTKRR